ncbi:hypothetical protein FH972_018754 [Carpinus fangiana]|uniref:Uncharacterized protein n=1 Tax=Carpinus fangiana TaxID=176857 RepID=A0A5N6RR42_9ROSI|nr:hypothetical protein FH972_018754 [Carpinus fangiana]
MRHIERTEHKKATKLSNLFPWRGQYKKSSDAFDLCPEINIPRKTTPLYLGICQMTPKLFPKVFSLSGFQGFGSKSPDSIYSQIRKRRDVKVDSIYSHIAVYPCPSDQLPHPHWANIGCPKQQLRSVVLALGGFLHLHSQFLCHLSKPQSSGSSASSTAVMFLA